MDPNPGADRPSTFAQRLKRKGRQGFAISPEAKIYVAQALMAEKGFAIEQLTRDFKGDL